VGQQKRPRIETAAALDLPSVIPVFPLAGVILLPGAELPLNIFEPRYLAMTRDAIAGTQLIGMIQPSDPSDRSFEPPIYTTGCLGRLSNWSDTPDGRILVSLTGICRFEVERELTERTTPYRQTIVRYDRYVDDLAREPCSPVDRSALTEALQRFLAVQGVKADWSGIEDMQSDILVNALAMSVPFAPGEKQALLEAPTIDDRARILIMLLEMAAADTGGGDAPPVQ
jgi:Lon protease-like protein